MESGAPPAGAGRRRAGRVNAVAAAVGKVNGVAAATAPRVPKEEVEEDVDANSLDLLGEEEEEEGGDEETSKSKEKKWEYIGIRHDGSIVGDARGVGFDCEHPPKRKRDGEASDGDEDDDDDDDCFMCQYGHNDRSGHVAQITNMISNRSGHVADRVLYKEAGLVQKHITDCLLPIKRSRVGGENATSSSSSSSASPGLNDTGETEEEIAARLRKQARDRDAAEKARRQVENHNKYHSLNPEVICAENVRYVRQVIRLHAARIVRRDPETLAVEPNQEAINGMFKAIGVISGILRLKPKQLMFNPSAGAV